MNPIALKLGIINIYWYSIILFIAFLLGTFLAIKEAKNQKIDIDLFYDFIFYLVPICLIGARLYFVLFHWDYYSLNITEILEVWNGGLAIHGGIIFGLIFAFFYTKKHKMNFLRICDISVISLILGQAIGRWGNFFNGEAHGPITTLSHLKNLKIPNFIIKGMYINGDYYIPTFLYESIWCLVGFLLLITIKNKLKLGQITSIYFIWYGIGRLLIESIRTDSLMLGNVKIAQLISICMILIGIIFCIKCKKKETGELNEE